MWLFRKGLDLSRAVSRPVTADDLTPVSRLLRDGARRYYGLSGADLPALLAAGHGVALVAGTELYAVAVVSVPTATTCWLRAVAVAEGVEVRAAVAALITALHTMIAARGLRHIFFAGDDSAEGWLAPLLLADGYQKETEVLVYEKSNLAIPAGGNPDVQVRGARPVDLPEVMRLDRACFEPQWTKDDTILGPAIEQGPFFMVAELDGALVGYAYATTHFSGRLVHLVRIAVAPEWRGARIGVRLLADLVAYADDLHATAVTLNTQSYNLNAQRLYRWFGFVATGERQAVLRRGL